MSAKPPLMAVTLHRPWAYAVAELGKDVENRSWPCTLPPGALLAIHAGKKWDEEGAAWIRRAVWDELPGLDSPLHPQGIIAIVAFAGNVTESDSLWFTGPLAWRLQDVVVLPEAVPWIVTFVSRSPSRTWRGKGAPPETL